MRYGVITIDDKAHGKSVFAETSVTVQTMFEYFENGKSLDHFLEDYPAVNKKQAIEVLHMAKSLINNEPVLKANFPGNE